MNAALQGLCEVFSKPRYAAGALLTFLAAFIVAMLIPHYRLLDFVAESPALEGVKTRTFGDLFLLSLTSFPSAVIFVALIISLAFAVNAALGTYYLRHRMPVGKTAATSVAGLFFGLLGMGCASCGSVLLSALVGGASLGLLSILPLRGLEFGIIGAAVSIGATYLTAKRVAAAEICAIPSKG